MRDLKRLTPLAGQAWSRRHLLKQAGLGMTVAGLGMQFNNGVKSAQAAESSPVASAPPEHAPTSEPVFEIIATIGGAMTVGETSTGTVRAIPITGGTVKGEGISGRVVPGGADWQRTRADSVTEIEATYAIELDGGALVKVVNSGIIVPPAEQGEAPYFRTHIRFTAPQGDYAWLNEAIFLCRAGLHPSQDNAVLVEVFRLV